MSLNVINLRKGDFGEGLTRLECVSPPFLAHYYGDGGHTSAGIFP